LKFLKDFFKKTAEQQNIEQPTAKGQVGDEGRLKDRADGHA